VVLTRNAIDAVRGSMELWSRTARKNAARMRSRAECAVLERDLTDGGEARHRAADIGWRRLVQIRSKLRISGPQRRVSLLKQTARTQLAIAISRLSAGGLEIACDEGRP
jgi:hypothetical protein